MRGIIITLASLIAMFHDVEHAGWALAVGCMITIIEAIVSAIAELFTGLDQEPDHPTIQPDFSHQPNKGTSNEQ